MKILHLAGFLLGGALSWACAADSEPNVPNDAPSPVATGAPRVDAGPGEGGIDGGGGIVRSSYGKSALGEDLLVERVTPANPNGKSALLVFGVHGFEDAWPHDGRALFSIAEDVVAHFGSHPDELAGWTLYVVPSANPDGMEHGTNNAREDASDAYGRCTSEGKDINRNFSSAAFAEHDALRDLVDRAKPAVLVDFHGWYNCYYGKSAVGDAFARAFNADYPGKPAKYCFVKSTGAMDCGASLGGTFHANTSITHDLFAEWASSRRGIPAALVEFPAPDFDLDGNYDTVPDAETGGLVMAPSTLAILAERTRTGVRDLLGRFQP